MRVGSGILVMLTLVSGCSTVDSPEQARLRRGVAFARTTLQHAGQDPLSALSLGSTEQLGGTVLQYLAANMPDNADLPNFEEGRATRPWTVVLRPKGRDVIIEGYGKDLGRPVIVDTAHIAARPGR